MNKKSLLTALLALGLVLTGCNGEGDKPTTSTPSDPNTVTKIEGNGTSWPTEVQVLIDKAVAHAKDEITLPFIDTQYYSATYAEDDTENITYVTEIICENDTTITREQSLEYLNLYTEALMNLDFDVDKSDYNKYRTYYAQKLIKGNEYFVVNFGLTALSMNEETYETFDAFFVQVGYVKVIARAGWVGDNLSAWPTDGITEAVGKDIPHPSCVSNDGIQYFGGYNTLPLEDTYGNEVLLDCYILWIWGSLESDLSAYASELSDLYWTVQQYDDPDNESYVAFDMISQTVIEFFYMSQSGYGSGICLFIYLNDANSVMEEKTSWPSEMDYLPAYVEDEKTFSYFHTSSLSGTYVMDVLIVGGTAENADELYAAQLEVEGFTVTLETDSQDPTFQFYYAVSVNAEAMFYVDVCPNVGTSLIIQSIGF